MRRLLICGLIVAGFWAGRAHAADLSFSKFHADITVNQDASISVVETITADFASPHHGIYRTIPFRFTTLNGEQAAIPVSVQSIAQDGRPAQSTETNDGTSVIEKIGDPDLTMTGAHVYTIAYTAQAAVNFFSDHDELYWNVTGDHWDAPLSNISAAVHFPETAGGTNSPLPRISQVACYTGRQGSTAKNCQATHDSSTATFSSQDFLTVVVGWPTGYTIKPNDYVDLRTAGTTTDTSAYRPQSATGAWMFAVMLALILCLGTAAFFIFQRLIGRGEADPRPIIPQYDPPTDVKPAEASVLVNMVSDGKVISATIIDLAVHGFLRIEETESSVFLGLGHTKSFEFIQGKPADGSLRPYERQLLDALFRQPKYPAVNGRISLSTFTHHRTSTYDSFAAVTDAVDAVGDERGWFGRGTGWRALIRSMTPAGRDLRWHLKGFQLYLKTAERYRLQWQEKEHIFEAFLPYAMVLGVAQEWSKALAPLMTKPPDWYQGNFSSGFNTLVLYHALSGLSTQVAASGISGVSAAASGSSGFGGGGFSGGGGGGGGGGGW